MATYRNVHISFWTDPKVDDDFTPEDKYFYLYLLTNPHTNLCGCYEISTKQITRETGYNEDTVSRLLNRMESVHEVIKYDPKTKEVLIKHWGRYNWANSPKTMAGAQKAAEDIKADSFKKYVLSEIDTLLRKKNTLSASKGYPMHTSDSDTDSVSDTDTDTDSVSDTVSDAGDEEEEMPF